MSTNAQPANTGLQTGGGGPSGYVPFATLLQQQNPHVNTQVPLNVNPWTLEPQSPLIYSIDENTPQDVFRFDLLPTELKAMVLFYALGADQPIVDPRPSFLQGSRCRHSHARLPTYELLRFWRPYRIARPDQMTTRDLFYSGVAMSALIGADYHRDHWIYGDGWERAWLNPAPWRQRGYTLGRRRIETSIMRANKECYDLCKRQLYQHTTFVFTSSEALGCFRLGEPGPSSCMQKIVVTYTNRKDFPRPEPTRDLLIFRPLVWQRINDVRQHAHIPLSVRELTLYIQDWQTLSWQTPAVFGLMFGIETITEGLRVEFAENDLLIDNGLFGYPIPFTRGDLADEEAQVILEWARSLAFTSGKVRKLNLRGLETCWNGARFTERLHMFFEYRPLNVANVAAVVRATEFIQIRDLPIIFGQSQFDPDRVADLWKITAYLGKSVNSNRDGIDTRACFRLHFGLEKIRCRECSNDLMEKPCVCVVSTLSAPG